MSSVNIAKELLKTRSLWGVLLIVVAGDLLVRLALPTGRIPKGAFHSSEFRQQVEQYSASIPVDMLIVGSSVAAVNYPPMPLDESIRREGEYPEFTTYNTGIRGCNYQCIAVGVREHYLKVYRPRIALVVIDPVDLNIDNQTVVERSLKFSADMDKGSIARTGRNLLSEINHLYGFKEEVRDWVTSGGQWSFDPASLGVRGYVDMGSTRRTRWKDVPQITQDSDLTHALRELVSDLASSGTTVILKFVKGDSLAQSLISEEALRRIRWLLDVMTQHPNVHELRGFEPGFTDADYIDTLHLSTQAAALNSEQLGATLVQTDLLSD